MSRQLAPIATIARTPMIPVKSTEEQRAFYTRAIVEMWNSATHDQVRRGRMWYPTAHKLAAEISVGDTTKGAGVLAALSANKSWTENCRLARKAFDEGTASGHVALFTFGRFWSNRQDLWTG